MCALPAAPLARRVARRPAPKGGPDLASPAARTPRVASFVARGRRAASQRVAAASPVAPNGQLPPRRTRQRAWGAAPRRSGMRASGWGLPSNARASRPQAGATRSLGWPRTPALRARPPRRRGGGWRGAWTARPPAPRAGRLRPLLGTPVMAVAASAAAATADGGGGLLPPVAAAAPAGRGAPRRQPVRARAGRAPRPPLRWA